MKCFRRQLPLPLRLATIYLNDTSVIYRTVLAPYIPSSPRLPSSVPRPQNFVIHVLQLQANLIGKTGAEPHKPIILMEFWRDVAPFFQKALVLPAPSQDLVASTAPLHTWEYDEIPWMEVGLGG